MREGSLMKRALMKMTILMTNDGDGSLPPVCLSLFELYYLFDLFTCVGGTGGWK
jgi:hypothetical protein